MTLTRSGDENQRKTYCILLILIKQSLQRLISIKKGSKELKNDNPEQDFRPIKILIVQNIPSDLKGLKQNIIRTVDDVRGDVLRQS